VYTNIKQASTQLIRNAYRTIKAGNIQFLMDLLSVDAVWQMPEIDNVPFAGTWKGPQQVGQFFARVAETQDVATLSLRNFSLKPTKWLFWAVSTGKTSRSKWVHVWTVEGGRVRHMRDI
jgi:ketosteroid isomerase-like protein